MIATVVILPVLALGELYPARSRPHDHADLFALKLGESFKAYLGVFGCLLAVTVHGYSTGTMNLQTLSELAFAFRVTPAIVAISLAFALLMGIAGGLLPALRASRLSIAAAVREG